MWYQKKPIPQLSIFCLIQSINNYVQINTYWRYIVRIMASNILLLASKIVFLTSQGLVGAGMNCRALLAMPTRKHNLVQDFFMFEIPTCELYCSVTISGLKLIYCRQTTKVEMLRFSLKINISSYSNHFYTHK